MSTLTADNHSKCHDLNIKWKTHWAGILSCWHTKWRVPAGPAAAEPQLLQQQFLQCLRHLEENATLRGSSGELQSNKKVHFHEHFKLLQQPNYYKK